MKLWNLSHLDDLTPNVLASVDKDATVEVLSPRRRRIIAPTTTLSGVVGTAVLVAAISLTTLQVNVCGSDEALRMSSVATVSNAHSDRPPLTLIFGAAHPLKWDAAKEAEMLARAAASLAKSKESDNEVNLIHAVLKEDLPSSREEATNLASLGIKLG
jgi:hypothetical protein